MGRKPFRVIFTYEASDRPGTIVAGDLDAARREAKSVVDAGGTAVIRYVGEDDRGGYPDASDVIAIYSP